MSENKNKYSKQKLAEFKNILEEKLEKSNAELTTIKQDVKNQKEYVAQANTDFNDNSKHFQRQATNKRLARRLQRKSRELRAALGRIENETYGICDRTGALINEARLRALPTARFNIHTTAK